MALNEFIKGSFRGSVGGVTGQKWKTRKVLKSKIFSKAPPTPLQTKNVRGFERLQRILRYEELLYPRERRKNPKDMTWLNMLTHRNKAILHLEETEFLQLWIWQYDDIPEAYWYFTWVPNEHRGEIELDAIVDASGDNPIEVWFDIFDIKGQLIETTEPLSFVGDTEYIDITAPEGTTIAWAVLRRTISSENYALYNGVISVAGVMPEAKEA